MGCCRFTSLSGGAPSSTDVTLEARPSSVWISWNAQSLVHSVNEVRRCKFEFLRRLVRRAQTVMLQETRMTPTGLRSAPREFSHSHWLAMNGESESIGEVAVLVSKHICEAALQCIKHVKGPRSRGDVCLGRRTPRLVRYPQLRDRELRDAASHGDGGCEL